jgi:hypothetical protein
LRAIKCASKRLRRRPWPSLLAPDTVLGLELDEVLVDGFDSLLLEPGDPHQHPGATLQEIADVLGVSHERVRQIEGKALRKLRHPKLARHLVDFLVDEQLADNVRARHRPPPRVPPPQIVSHFTPQSFAEMLRCARFVKYYGACECGWHGPPRDTNDTGWADYTAHRKANECAYDLGP